MRPRCEEQCESLLCGAGGFGGPVGDDGFGGCGLCGCGFDGGGEEMNGGCTLGKGREGMSGGKGVWCLSGEGGDGRGGFHVLRVVNARLQTGSK